nr:transposase [Pseudostreptobacillus hongkongensis]
MNPDNGRDINYNKEFRMYSKISYDNITSDIGKRYRLNRSIQVEGVFAVLKKCMDLKI